jgi:hypothetical protein
VGIIWCQMKGRRATKGIWERGRKREKEEEVKQRIEAAEAEWLYMSASVGLGRGTIPTQVQWWRHSDTYLSFRGDRPVESTWQACGFLRVQAQPASQRASKGHNMYLDAHEPRISMFCAGTVSSNMHTTTRNHPCKRTGRRGGWPWLQRLVGRGWPHGRPKGWRWCGGSIGYRTFALHQGFGVASSDQGRRGSGDGLHGGDDVEVGAQHPLRYMANWILSLHTTS